MAYCLFPPPRLDGSMETTNEILDSASHDCPLVTQTYGTAVATGTHVPSSPTRLGKSGAADLEGGRPGLLAGQSWPPALSPGPGRLVP